MEQKQSKTATSFDAVGTVGELRSKGIEPDQAEAMAKGMNDPSAAAVVDAVSVFQAEMEKLRADLGGDISAAILRAVLYSLGITLGIGTLVAGIVAAIA